MVFLAIFCTVSAAILSQYFNKKLLSTQRVENVVMAMFTVCFILSSAFVLIFGERISFVLPVFLVGVLSAVATIFFARAVKINLSRSILLLAFINIIVIILSAVFLKEWQLLDPRHFQGVFNLLGTIGLFIAVYLFGTGGEGNMLVSRRNWAFAALIYVLVAGWVNFLIKYFAVSGVVLHNYLFSWYAGNFISVIFIFFLIRRHSDYSLFKLKLIPEVVFLYISLGITTFGAMLSFFIAFYLAPAVLVLSIYTFLLVFGTILIGLFVFKEKSKFQSRDWAGLIVGAVAVIVLLIGNSH